MLNLFDHNGVSLLPEWLTYFPAHLLACPDKVSAGSQTGVPIRRNKAVAERKSPPLWMGRAVWKYGA